LPLEEFVKLAAGAGFAGADVDLGYGVANGVSKLRDLFSRYNLRFGGWNAPDWRGELRTLDDALPDFTRRCRIAAELNMDSCATWIMPSSDRPFADNWKFHVDRLRTVANILADHGLRFGLEFVSPRHLRRQHPHEFIFTPGQMLELAGEVGPSAGLLVDCFHIHSAGETWERISSIPGDKIVLGHVNDAPNVPISSIVDGERLLPGDGVIDLNAFVAAMRQTGYCGPVSLEVFNVNLRAMPPETAARTAGNAVMRALGKMTFE
jgi:sugar phosphate isomerase/epimerase